MSLYRLDIAAEPFGYYDVLRALALKDPDRHAKFVGEQLNGSSAKDKFYSSPIRLCAFSMAVWSAYRVNARRLNTLHSRPSMFHVPFANPTRGVLSGWSLVDLGADLDFVTTYVVPLCSHAE